MWRRACLGDRDAVLALGYLWAGFTIALLIVVAARTTWLAGVGCGLVVALLTCGLFALRRSRWNRLVRLQVLEGIAAAGVLLRQRSQG